MDTTTEAPAGKTRDPVASVPQDELTQIARDISAGRIFCDRHLGEHGPSLPEIFMPIGLGGLASVDVTTIGLVYEYLDKAGPMAVNGCPMFFSCRLLNLVDAKFVIEKVKAIASAIESA